MIKRTYHLRSIAKKNVVVATCVSDPAYHLPIAIKKALSVAGVGIVCHNHKHLAGISICEVEVNRVIPKAMMAVVRAYLPPQSSVHMRRGGFLVNVSEYGSNSGGVDTIEINCTGDNFKGHINVVNRFADELILSTTATKRNQTFQVQSGSSLSGLAIGCREEPHESYADGKFFIIGIPKLATMV